MTGAFEGWMALARSEDLLESFFMVLSKCTPPHAWHFRAASNSNCASNHQDKDIIGTYKVAFTHIHQYYSSELRIGALFRTNKLRQLVTPLVRGSEGMLMI